MFESFFPKPKLFLSVSIIWAISAYLLWSSLGQTLGELIGLPFNDHDQSTTVGIGFFTTNQALCLYSYLISVSGLFYAFWAIFFPHKWLRWSVLGTQIVLFSTYMQVQVAVALNNWRRPFFDKISESFTSNSTVAAYDLYDLLISFAGIAFFAIFLYTATKFIVSHYIFRWRTAMNEYYMANWQSLRHVEGASQRIQEDTMRFATIVEGLGISIVEALMTLIAFVPVLIGLSEYVEQLPIIGEIPAPLLTASFAWSLFGTIFLSMVGIKLPGLEFNNQKVEAAYRKELVYGEDSAERASPVSVKQLFMNIRKNYFKLYFHYMYFNLARSFYLQADAIFTYIILVPTIIAGAITFGILQQILTALNQVSNSFQFLVNSWTTIVELLSVRKRLYAFEQNIEGETQSESHVQLCYQYS
ncbi:MAG: peptide antibiotic transporter SbmA [Gammaproteobacteria bacterium]